MLVLSRRVGESVEFSNGVRITVVEQRGNRVRLGIEADKSVRVMRSELGSLDDYHECQGAKCSACASDNEEGVSTSG